MNELLVLFIVLNTLNVILATIKSIVTVKGGKLSAASMNALTFFVYTYVLIYMNCDLPMFIKALVVAICNFIGVYAVKLMEEKLRKDKLWKVEATVPTEYKEAVDLDLRDIPHSYIVLSNKHTLFNFYCATQADSKRVKDIIDQYGAKYFVAESKTLS
jgi:uncharacterized protein YebE (UPF0316 family)